MPEMHLYHQPDSWRYTRECHYRFQSPSQPKSLFRFETTRHSRRRADLLGTTWQDFELFRAMASHIRY